MKEFNFQGVDFGAVMAVQRYNIEAINEINRLALENVQTIARRQAEILQETVSEGGAAARSILESKSPQDAAKAQVQATRKAFEQGFERARELAELTAKSSADLFEVFNKRLAEGFDEINGTAKARK